VTTELSTACSPRQYRAALSSRARRQGFSLSGLATIAVVATPGVAATGTLFGAMTTRTRARDLVLAVVLFPLLSPTLLTAVVASRELLGGMALRELGDYLRILGVFDVAFIAAGLGLFGTLLDG
jgi:heme exporter protein B